MKRSIWVWHCDKPQGGFLFRGNPNPKTPAYHLGDIEDLIFGGVLVFADTRRALELEFDIAEWNVCFPQYRVKPRSVMVEIRPYRIRKKTKESEVK